MTLLLADPDNQLPKRHDAAWLEKEAAVLLEPADSATPLNSVDDDTEQTGNQQGSSQQNEPPPETLNLPVSLVTYGEQAKDYARQAKSKNTRRAYASD